MKKDAIKSCLYSIISAVAIVVMAVLAILMCII